MFPFALRNLVRNRVRTLLALLGLAGSTAGVVVLVAISFGAQRMVGDAMAMSTGLIVLERDAPDPLLSKIETKLAEKISRVDGVTVVVPEVWALAFSIEEVATLKGGVMNTSALLGFDADVRAKLRGGGLFARNLVAGRAFTRSEPDGVVISKRMARDHGKTVGSTLRVRDNDFTVTGIFETGTPIFDNALVAQEEKVRSIAEISSGKCNNFFVELAPGEDPDVMARRVAAVLPQRVDVKSTSQWGRDVNGLVANLDPYLAAISFVAGAIGALGVVNTMLMSVRERVREFGVLRASGWTKGDVFRLVLTESALLGGAGGVAGALLGRLASQLSAAVVPIQPDAPITLIATSAVAAVVLGALGGVYPAIYASRLDPIVAIRGGA